MNSSQRRIALYALIVFVSLALLLVLEIVASRLIAPYVGVSLYTWSAVIGVMLAGLSIGNALGGAWADRRATADAAGACGWVGDSAADRRQRARRAVDFDPVYDGYRTVSIGRRCWYRVDSVRDLDIVG